jgi:hypothetical protein
MKDFRPNRVAANERLRSLGDVVLFASSDVWFNEFNAITNARVEGLITEQEDVLLKKELWSRTVDLSYSSLRGLPVRDAGPQEGEFWLKVLEIQQRRKAGKTTEWDAEAQIQQLIKVSN